MRFVPLTQQIYNLIFQNIEKSAMVIGLLILPMAVSHLKFKGLKANIHDKWVYDLLRRPNIKSDRLFQHTQDNLSTTELYNLQ